MYKMELTKKNSKSSVSPSADISSELHNTIILLQNSCYASNMDTL